MEKKEELLITAAEIIWHEGIQKLTIDYLAKKTQLTKGGVLYHFSNKANLIKQMNLLAIERFEEKLNFYKGQLNGKYIFTRAYAMATIDFLKGKETILMPAVFISSIEEKSSHQLWEDTSAKWEQSFCDDTGDPMKILQLRLMCDGIWFSTMYHVGQDVKSNMEKLIIQHCESMRKE